MLAASLGFFHRTLASEAVQTLVSLTPGSDDDAVVVGLRARLFDAVAEVRLENSTSGAPCVRLRADLETRSGSAHLRRQREGLSGALTRLGEQELGDAVLDERFVIRCDDDGHALLNRLKVPLAALGPPNDHANLTITPTMLEVLWGLDGLAAVVGLWEATVRDRLLGGAH